MKRLPKLLSAFLAFAVFVTCLGCGETKHEHTYNEVAAAQATCTERGNVEYYKCDCGKTFVKRGGEYVEASSSEIFTEPLGHAFTKRVKEIEATCTENGVRAHAYCGDCGKWFVKEGSSYVEASGDDFSTAKKSHVFDREVVADEYRVAEATDTEPQKFAKSCVCGKRDDSHEHTFSFGKRLPSTKVTMPHCTTRTRLPYRFTTPRKTFTALRGTRTKFLPVPFSKSERRDRATSTA